MDLKGCKVLVVDDHSLMRQMVISELKKCGADCIDEAVDGAEGFRKIASAGDVGAPYRIVFLDWSMPEMNGHDVLLACRADARFNTMAIVMLTSETEEYHVLEALEHGATAYISKPFQPGDIIQKLADVLKWEARNKENTHD